MGGDLKICSLLPSSTEILYALGLDNEVVAITHECDYPPQAMSKPQVTESLIGHQRLTEVFDTILLLGDLTGRRETADNKVLELRERLARVRELVRGGPERAGVCRGRIFILQSLRSPAGGRGRNARGYTSSRPLWRSFQ